MFVGNSCLIPVKIQWVSEVFVICRLSGRTCECCPQLVAWREKEQCGYRLWHDWGSSCNYHINTYLSLACSWPKLKIFVVNFRIDAGQISKCCFQTMNRQGTTHPASVWPQADWLLHMHTHAHLHIHTHIPVAVLSAGQNGQGTSLVFNSCAL